MVRIVDETAKQLPELPRGQIVGEPFRRDTAPCVGLGAALIAARDPDARECPRRRLTARVGEAAPRPRCTLLGG